MYLRAVMKHVIESIRACYPVSDEALHAMQDKMEVFECPKHTRLIRRGVTERYVYFIEEGVVRTFFHPKGNDTTTWFSREGDIIFGMRSLYYGSPSEESAETLTDCRLYRMTTQNLNALYTTNIDIANWGRCIHQDVHCRLSRFFVERLQQSPKERYENFMKHFPGLINRVKLKYVAEFLGISIYTLSRIRAGK